MGFPVKTTRIPWKATDFISVLKQEKIRVALEHALVPERVSSPEWQEQSWQDGGSVSRNVAGPGAEMRSRKENVCG